jgi:hypothetical protein
VAIARVLTRLGPRSSCLAQWPYRCSIGNTIIEEHPNEALGWEEDLRRGRLRRQAIWSMRPH